MAAGGTALDPEVVTQLLRASRRTDGLGALTAREHDVLALMAEGRSNGAIADTLVISERAVEKHVANIFSKFSLTPSGTDHRRVLAVLRYLGSGPAETAAGPRRPPQPLSPRRREWRSRGPGAGPPGEMGKHTTLRCGLPRRPVWRQPRRPGCQRPVGQPLRRPGRCW